MPEVENTQQDQQPSVLSDPIADPDENDSMNTSDTNVTPNTITGSGTSDSISASDPYGTLYPKTDLVTSDPVNTSDPNVTPNTITEPGPSNLVNTHDPEVKTDVQSDDEEKRKNVALDKNEQNNLDGPDYDKVFPVEDPSNPQRINPKKRKENESNEQGICNSKPTLDSGIASGNEYSSSQEVTEVCSYPPIIFHTLL